MMSGWPELLDLPWTGLLLLDWLVTPLQLLLSVGRICLERRNICCLSRILGGWWCVVFSYWFCYVDLYLPLNVSLWCWLMVLLVCMWRVHSHHRTWCTHLVWSWCFDAIQEVLVVLDCDTNMCWKCLRLTFSSDLEEAMFETGKSLSTIQKLILFLRKYN